MLYLTVKNGNSMRDIGWNVGIIINPILADDIVAIQADGDERDFIERNFQNLLSRRNGFTAYWYGDLARTIALNLGIATY